MLSFSRLNIQGVVLLALLAQGAWGQLPDGAGKAETEKLCSQCHEIERSISLRQDRAGWATTLDKMVALGAAPTEKETTAVIDYLAAHFPAAFSSEGSICLTSAGVLYVTSALVSIVTSAVAPILSAIFVAVRRIFS